MTHPLPTIRNFLLGVLALTLALLGQRQLRAHELPAALILLAGGLLLLLITLRRQTLWQPLTVLPVARLPWRQAWWHWLPALAALGVSLYALHQVDIEHPDLTFWRLYGGSVLLFLLWALIFSPRPAQPVGETPEAHVGVRAPRHSAFHIPHALLLILLLAAFFRLYRFADLPFGVWYDEAENGLQAMRILEHAEHRPLFEGAIHAPAHYLYLIALFFRWFDVSVQSVRGVSVVMGLATVLAAYLVGRELWGRAGGLILAFLLAVSRWNVNFSRIGMYNASTPLFELLTIGLLLRALRRGRYGDYALAGLCLGLGLCFYAAFQLFVGVVILFLLALAVLERGFLRRAWLGIVILFVMALLVVAPVIHYAYDQPETYFARTKDTSILAGQLLSERWPALLENVRKHLLMFNYVGDPNGRHNLPGEPMLDPYSAALFVLGIGWALWRIRQPRAFLLLAWLGVMLLGGILSLDFEGPQSLRAIGAMPAAYLLAALPLVALYQEWQAGGGRYRPQWVAAPLLMLLTLTAYSNYDTYFNRQANDFAVWNAFSTPETLAATRLAALAAPENADSAAYVISYFQGHPTLNFVARGAPPYQRIETTDHLPLSWPAGKKILLLLNADSRALFSEAQQFYPQAQFEELQPPFGGPTVLYSVRLTPQDVTAVQGLMGSYYVGSAWAGTPVITRQEATLQFDWSAAPPLPAPFSAEWSGVLRVANYGPHQFFLQAPAYAELYIGEEQLLAGTGTLSGGLELAEGNHNLRVRVVGEAGPLSLAWRPPDRGPEIIPASALYVPPVTSNGLLGTYYANDDGQGPPAFAKIEPQINLYFHVPPLPRPYTVEWTGKLAIPQAGQYGFGLESIDDSTLWIDEQQVTHADRPNVLQAGTLTLTSGLHDIRLRYHDRTDHTHVNLYWTPPGGNSQPIPAAALIPPQGNYERVTLPSLTALVFDQRTPGVPTLITTPLAGNVRPFYSGLNQPRGIAAGLAGRIYVAETGGQRVLMLAPTGELLKAINGGAAAFRAPFDLAVDTTGRLFVLDAEAGRIDIFDAELNYLQSVPTTAGQLASQFDRARGLFVTEQGQLWLAHTPGARALAIDESGATVKELPIWPGGDSQPVDLAIGVNGAIFVTDAGLNKLVRFAADGRRELAWELPVANSMDGSHLAVDGAGQLYLTQPEAHTVAKLGADGEQIGQWRLPDNVKPVGVAVDASGRIWLADVQGGNVLVIEPGE